jgi:hypothetical protein
MTDDFGKIMVFGDYEGNLEAIVDKLNLLRWSFDSVRCEWAVEKSTAAERGDNKKGRKRREVIVLNGDLPDPSLRPVKKSFVLKDGRRCFAGDADASIIEQWEADKDAGAFNVDQYTLHKLSALISPHLRKGTIEFVAVLVSSGVVRHERLLVRFDGCAEWHVCVSSDSPVFADHWTCRETEYYDPVMLVPLPPGGGHTPENFNSANHAKIETEVTTGQRIVGEFHELVEERIKYLRNQGHEAQANELGEAAAIAVVKMLMAVYDFA